MPICIDIDAIAADPDVVGIIDGPGYLYCSECVCADPRIVRGGAWSCVFADSSPHAHEICDNCGLHLLVADRTAENRIVDFYAKK